ncbi:hypothetical protein BTH95_06585 [Lactobacillus delbrueckii subsp. bulgaricus]|nr:hypothetical protein [Lactobacillus delbrueckii subsp. bulgaricus]MBT8862407.1 hypothetical protein [Lactobacillus delbrueckii subsp. bulgaricus]MBT8863953.1 hypothetical protein [Lactobacillus delbrueckii subsp. bulgaricus]MBT8868829.1 hypothetical protein [Lactobacillus delbrueckii subsp. bulgaricus]MBT8873540.1 hypothetical protein [Lactobacillus delbrueckii subsp. bulgaricus]
MYLRRKITFINYFIYSSFIYSFLLFMPKVINKLRLRMKSISSLNALGKKNIEKIKSQVNDFTNSEYSVVIDLLRSNNTVPYIEYSMPKPGTILSDNTWFVRSPCNKKVFKKITTENGQVITVNGISQYKLTPSKYRELKDIYAKTGAISHFKMEY